MRQALRVGVSWQSSSNQLCAVKSIQRQPKIKPVRAAALRAQKDGCSHSQVYCFLPKAWLALRRQSLWLLQSWMGRFAWGSFGVYCWLTVCCFKGCTYLAFFFAVSPSISGSDGSSQLTVTEGSLVSLICESSGIPPPSLTWKKNGG